MFQPSGPNLRRSYQYEGKLDTIARETIMLQIANNVKTKYSHNKINLICCEAFMPNKFRRLKREFTSAIPINPDLS